MTSELQPSSKKLTPDQVLTAEELEAQALDDAMLGCPGHEHLEEERQQPNWPPEKVPFSRAREIISNLRFRLEHPHADRAFQNLIDEKNKREG